MAHARAGLEALFHVVRLANSGRVDVGQQDAKKERLAAALNLHAPVLFADAFADVIKRARRLYSHAYPAKLA